MSPRIKDENTCFAIFAFLGAEFFLENFYHCWLATSP